VPVSLEARRGPEQLASDRRVNLCRTAQVCHLNSLRGTTRPAETLDCVGSVGVGKLGDYHQIRVRDDGQ
jgi:hypothetical protein